MRPLIKLENVNKIYKSGKIETHVLKDINLEIYPGEFVAIMGPSGSGKTTLMNILGLLDRPSSGKYYLNGMEVSLLDDNEISKLRNEYIGFVFQAFYLISYLNVLDNVLLPMLYSSKKLPFEKRAKELLEKLGMKDRMYFKPNQLSGGQKQRVAIARALLNDPFIILADEPTGQLDSKSSKAVMEIFRNLNREGKTIILVTHDPFVANYAKRKIYLKDGKIVDKL
ncbi:MAG TPA: ABC transporter ATP-binding protein [Desulfurobacteriaceae bacterium]|nr:ABC transporter ATP-binding protein [Desulfurobacteriaceae bacterium]